MLVQRALLRAELGEQRSALLLEPLQLRLEVGHLLRRLFETGRLFLQPFRQVDLLESKVAFPPLDDRSARLDVRRLREELGDDLAREGANGRPCIPRERPHQLRALALQRDRPIRADPVRRFRLGDRGDDVPLFLADTVELLEKLKRNVIFSKETGRQLADQFRFRKRRQTSSPLPTNELTENLLRRTSFERIHQQDAQRMGVEHRLELRERFLERLRLEFGCADGRHRPRLCRR